MESVEEHKLVQKKYRFINQIENYAKSADSAMRMGNFVDIKQPLEEIQKQYPYYKSKGGIPFYYNNNTAYVDASDAHNLVIGSTGSKKTRLIVMPTVKILAYAGESMIIADPKAEVYERTAYELKNQGYQINVINFRNPEEGDSWNPLEIPFSFFKGQNFDKAREHANDVAINLVLSEMSHDDPYWDRSAYNLLFGLIQLAFIICKDKTSVSMRDVLKLRATIFPNDEIVNKKYIEIAKTDQIVYHSLLGTVNAPERTRSSILSVFDQKVSCFSYQEDLSQMMDYNTINLNSIGNKKTAIFLIMPDEKTTYHQLVSLFIKQSYEYLIYFAQHLNERSFPLRINYILDEFSNLPAIRDFPAMISAARSRNIRFTLIVQSYQQLISKYNSDANTIKGNCTNLIFLNSRELDVLEEVSSLCGIQENNKYLFSVFGLQHLKKEKGQAVILSGRLFPFVTELVDIERFDNGIFEHLPIQKRVLRGKTKESTIWDFEQTIKALGQKENELKLREEELQQKERDIQQREENIAKAEKINSIFWTHICQYGVCLICFIAIFQVLYNQFSTNEGWSFSLSVFGLLSILLLYVVTISNTHPEFDEVIFFMLPMGIEVLRIVFFEKNLYALNSAFYMLLIYYIAVILPYTDIYTKGWKLGINNLVLLIVSNGSLLPSLLYFFFSVKIWYADIDGIIILGMLVVTFIHLILKAASNLNHFKKSMEDVLIVCLLITVGIYGLLNLTKFSILLVHNLPMF